MCRVYPGLTLATFYPGTTRAEPLAEVSNVVKQKTPKETNNDHQKKHVTTNLANEDVANLHSTAVI